MTSIVQAKRRVCPRITLQANCGSNKYATRSLSYEFTIFCSLRSFGSSLVAERLVGYDRCHPGAYLYAMAWTLGKADTSIYPVTDL